MKMRKIPPIAVAATLVVMGFLASGRPATAAEDVRVPKLSGLARAGERVFNKVCAECHGNNAAGSDKGPPLVHRIYHPGHHGDAAFYRAVQQGARAHHWPFGDMPPQPQIRRMEVDAIIQYVRELQKANGIF